MKKCKKCGIIKDSTDYYFQSKTADLLRTMCKRCFVDYSIPYMKNADQKNPEKRRAREQLRSKVRNGKISKGICVVCKSKKTEAHHPNYAKPLDVIWYCRKDHKKLHSKK